MALTLTHFLSYVESFVFCDWFITTDIIYVKYKKISLNCWARGPNYTYMTKFLKKQHVSKQLLKKFIWDVQYTNNLLLAESGTGLLTFDGIKFNCASNINQELRWRRFLSITFLNYWKFLF